MLPQKSSEPWQLQPPRVFFGVRSILDSDLIGGEGIVQHFQQRKAHLLGPGTHHLVNGLAQDLLPSIPQVNGAGVPVLVPGEVELQSFLEMLVT